MTDNRTTLIQDLQKLRESKGIDTQVKRTAGLALAALEMKPNAETLKGLIEDKLDNFNPKTGEVYLKRDKIQDAVKTWLGKGIIEHGVFNTKSDAKDKEADPNVLNKLAIIITSCVEGKLSEDMCQKNLTSLPEKMEEQLVNLKLILSTLKALGFKIYNEDNVLVAGTKNQRVVQSVEEWEEDNKASLPEKLADNLKKVLETYVLTANAYGSKWDSEKPVPVKVATRPVKTEDKKETSILALVTQMDGLTQFQKYYAGLLPIKAKNVGLVNLTGGAGLISYNSKNKTGSYLSYVDEEVDTNKNFVTGDVLGNIFEQLKKSLGNKNINLNGNEMKKIGETLQKLKEDELNLINLTSIIEKYIALKKYFGVEDGADKPGEDASLDAMVKHMAKLLEQHKDKLTKVEKNRKGLGNVLVLMARGVDTVV